MDAITVLRHDHEQVLALFDRLAQGPSVRTGALPSELGRRAELVNELVMLESAHEAVEEQHFWPMVRRAVPGGDELAARAIGQEQAGKRIFHELLRAHPTLPDYEDLLERFIAEGRQHIGFEQDEVWPRVIEAVDDRQLRRVGERLAAAKQNAPTRPHPSTPGTATVQRIAGPFAGAMDRMRDTVTGRGA